METTGGTLSPVNAAAANTAAAPAQAVQAQVVQNVSAPAARISPRLSGLSSDMTSYREGFKNLVRLVIFEGVVAVFLMCVDLYYVSYMLPQDSYYAVSGLANGAELKKPMVGLLSPNISRDAILRWSAASATEVMTFGFDDLDARMTRARRLFTPDGWSSFETALKKTALIKTMVENQQLLSTIPAASPSVVMEGLMQGRYTWVVEMPSILTLRAGEKKSTANMRIRLVIVKMPTAQNPMGIGINTWYSY